MKKNAEMLIYSEWTVINIITHWELDTASQTLLVFISLSRQPNFWFDGWAMLVVAFRRFIFIYFLFYFLWTGKFWLVGIERNKLLHGLRKWGDSVLE